LTRLYIPDLNGWFVFGTLETCRVLFLDSARQLVSQRDFLDAMSFLSIVVTIIALYLSLGLEPVFNVMTRLAPVLFK
jgi:hypothetical protein